MSDLEFTSHLISALERKEEVLDTLLREESRDIDVTELMRRFDNKVREAQRRRRLMQVLDSGMKLYKNVAALFVFVLLASILVVGTVEAAREPFFFWISGFTESYFQVGGTSLSKQPDIFKDVPTDWRECYFPHYVPPSFTTASYIGSARNGFIILSDETGQEKITIWQGDETTLSLMADWEDAKVSEVKVLDFPAQLVEKEGRSMLIWKMDTRYFSLDTRLEMAEVLKIAESISPIAE